ncbi:zinc ABC transporter substrate-binding protein [Candidatus Sumerlaeota bacterium]|nr:zinc ABC transporter substrate-binding protein [Candidatus Sumerlaeota bacterium]
MKKRNRVEKSIARRIGLAFGLAWIAVTASLQAKESVLNVVATTPDLADVAKQIGKNHVEAVSIASGSQNLHMIEAKPSFMMQAHKADLWIRIGLSLEAGYEKLIVEGARNKKILPGQPGYLDASAGISPLEVTTNQVAASAGLTLGDVHPQGNPHYWTDPYNIRIVAGTIAKKLKELDAAHAADYDTNLKDFIRRVDEAAFGAELCAAAGGDKLWEIQTAGKLDDYLKEHPAPALGGWFAKMRPLHGAKIVTYHRSWSYFANRFGLDVASEVEPKPGIPPGPVHIAELLDIMKAQNIKIILMEPFYDRKAPDEVAQKTGATVVVAAMSVTGQTEAKDYISMIDNVVNRITAAIAR